MEEQTNIDIEKDKDESFEEPNPKRLKINPTSDPPNVETFRSLSEICGETDEENKTRFLMELEFVQCLANPHYLYFLSQNRYFQDKAFIKYLEYLLYWKKPEYCKFIIYPHCLRFLDLLQQPAFRQRLSDLEYIQLIFSQQYFHWRYYRSNRLGIF